MRRTALGLLLSGVFLLSYLVAATDVAQSWSDGVAGSSGAVPAHLRRCAPGLNSHPLSGLSPNTAYVFQAIGKYSDGTEDIGAVLPFATPASSGASRARDDQLVSLHAAIVNDRTATLMAGYSPGTEHGDELESYRFVYAPGDHGGATDLRRVSGASTSAALGPLSSILSFNVGGLTAGSTYTFQAIGHRTSKDGWEIIARPVTFATKADPQEELATVPASPSTDPSRAWTLQMVTAPKSGAGRELASYMFVYNLDSRVASGVTDLRTTQNPIVVDKGDPGAGFKFCKVKTSGCGGCHGDWEAMQHQRASEAPVLDRMSAEIWINGDANLWEYEPGKVYFIEIRVQVSDRYERPRGAYNQAGFNLNVSAGRFEAMDDNVRVTGGNFSHVGSKSADVCHPQTGECRPYGQTVDDESRWAGELTNTLKGANITKDAQGNFKWRARWVAPPRQDPHGIAFNMAFMVANGNGLDDGTGNVSQGYTDQNLWDWWSFQIPRKIMCEKGSDRAECQERVLAYILPPSPPVNTNDPDGNGGNGDGGVTPTVPGEAWLAMMLASAFLVRRRRPRS